MSVARREGESHFHLSKLISILHPSKSDAAVLMKGSVLKAHQEMPTNYRQIRICGDLVEGAVFPGKHQAGENHVKTDL